MFSSSKPNKVLLIKPSAIGDVVHALPFLALMRQSWPHAYIAWLVTPACSGLLERHPLLSEVILFDRKHYGTAVKSAAAARDFRRFTQSLKDRDFDLVIDLQGLFRSGYLAWKTRAPVRVGLAYAREAAPLFYTHRIPRRPGQRHAIERYLDVAEALGLGRPHPNAPLDYPFNTTATHRAKATRLLEPLAGISGGMGVPPVHPLRSETSRDQISTSATGDVGVPPALPPYPAAVQSSPDAQSGTGILPVNGGPISPLLPPFAALIPGANWLTKRWPPHRFAALAHLLRTQLGLHTVTIGGPGDRELAAQIAPDLDLTGQSSLPETVALLELATIVIANDTGPMHIAAALRRPLVSLFGPTNPALTGPHPAASHALTVLRLDLPCSPCLSRTCSHTSCLAELTEQAVFDQVQKALATTGEPVVSN